MKVDWNVDTEGGGGLYEAGMYRVVPQEITEVEAKSGNMQLKVVTKITEGDNAGRKLTDYITLVESCTWKLVKFIKAMGVDVTQLESVDTSSGKFRAILNKCLNRSTYWKVEVKEEKGKVTDYVLDEEQTDTVDAPEFLND